MGSYASQLNRKQRWLIARYIKTKQRSNSAAGAGAAATDSSATAAK
jgi:phage terminase small subunit